MLTACCSTTEVSGGLVRYQHGHFCQLSTFLGGGLASRTEGKRTGTRKDETAKKWNRISLRQSTFRGEGSAAGAGSVSRRK